MSKTATETLHRILTNDPPADASPEKRLQIIKMRLYALRRLSEGINKATVGGVSTEP